MSLGWGCGRRRGGGGPGSRPEGSSPRDASPALLKSLPQRTPPGMSPDAQAQDGTAPRSLLEPLHAAAGHLERPGDGRMRPPCCASSVLCVLRVCTWLLVRGGGTSGPLHCPCPRTASAEADPAGGWTLGVEVTFWRGCKGTQLEFFRWVIVGSVAQLACCREGLVPDQRSSGPGRRHAVSFLVVTAGKLVRGLWRSPGLSSDAL